MFTTTRDILGSVFDSFLDESAQLRVDVRIDVLDSWTNSELAAVAPTTITWADGKNIEAEALVAV